MAPPPTLARQRPVVSINGQELSAAHLNAFIDLEVEAGIRSIGRAVLRLSDPGYTLSSNTSWAPLETAVKITDQTGGTYFDGEIVERAVSYTEDEGTVLEIVALDRSHRLSTATVVEARQKQTVSDALKALLSTHAMKGSLSAVTTTFEWTAVTGSALSIIDEVAERYGLDWIVQGKDFHLWKAASESPSGSRQATLRLGTDLTDFSLRVATGQDREVTVRGWDAVQQAAVVGTAKSVDDRNSSAFVKAPAKPVKVQRSDLVPTAVDDANNLAAAAAGRSRSIARGRGPINAAIVPGSTIEVTDAGVSSGRFYVREVEHRLTANGGWTRFVAGDRDAPRLVEPRDGGWSHSTFTHHSALIGVVTQINPQGPMVKVKLPVIGDQFETSWARVLMLGAGPGTGLFVMPEIHDEVLVLFPDGDLRNPVIVGGLHSKDRAPTTRAKTRNGETVEARAWASKQQHYIELADGQSPDRQHVKLGLGDSDQYVRVGKDKVEISTPNNVPIRIGSPKAWIEIGTDGSITLSADSVKIAAKNDVTVEGTSVKTTSSTTTTVEARTSLTLKGTAGASLEAAGPTKVKGAMVQIN